ncbi:RHS repeat domain-containing protein [Paenibacillus hunanensis]|uniref:RHS repeat domain-containing protein n=1 Tax=Paenibacillus hunanensis TaxID=539262 RepID=UPI002A6AA7AE|nr:RHS repeat domain-containing protein [Paenibacillus hunanensis]WPP39871.1 RHS repeat domain-containing protein [Paenibacillus hunanensis]
MNKMQRVGSVIMVVLLTMVLASHADAAATRSYQYDNSGRLLSITMSGYKITYVYDKNGNLIKRVTTSITK